MAGLLRPKVCYELVKTKKSQYSITSSYTFNNWFSRCHKLCAYEAGVDNLDTSISSFSNLRTAKVLYL